MASSLAESSGSWVYVAVQNKNKRRKREMLIWACKHIQPCSIPCKEQTVYFIIGENGKLLDKRVFIDFKEFKEIYIYIYIFKYIEE